MKKGFTLIELLAVIVILSIIALIATPVILNIINDVKQQSFKESINGIVRTAQTASTLDMKNNEELLYKFENNNWGENKLDINGQVPKYVEIKVNKEGQIRYAVTDESYCAIKEYDSELIIKKISDKNDDKKVQERYCKLDAVIPTDESCFTFRNGNITDYDESCGTDIVIPGEINGEDVLRISWAAFQYSKLTSVIIPNSVTSIGDEAFENNNLTSVIIPNSVTDIGISAFLNNDLTSVSISNGVISIGSSAFRYNKLTNIIIPKSVKTIGDFVFDGNDLISVSILNSVTSIGAGAFTNNQLPDNQAFIYNRNSDGSINYASLNSYGGKERNNVQIPTEVNGIKLTSIGSHAFYGNDLTSVTIPNSVTDIGVSAFDENELTSIIIPENVISIGQYAFAGNKLTSVTIKGKTSTEEFDNYKEGTFGSFNDSNINWLPNG